jgi:hypothetical protein
MKSNGAGRDRHSIAKVRLRPANHFDDIWLLDIGGTAIEVRYDRALRDKRGRDSVYQY